MPRGMQDWIWFIPMGLRLFPFLSANPVTIPLRSFLLILYPWRLSNLTSAAPTQSQHPEPDARN